MASAKHLIALLKGHVDGNDDHVLSVAMQAAAAEARAGHSNIASELRDLVDKARDGRSPIPAKAVPIVQPKGELAELLTVSYPDFRLSAMVLSDNQTGRLQRIVHENRERRLLTENGFSPARKLLLVGPPGSGKTMTASALAGELHLPLLTVRFESVITRYMGESAAKLGTIFEAMAKTRGLYFFDEFDAIGSRRDASNDVGEARRILNSFLQFLENDDSESVVVAASNHVELLDRALFRRFDEVIEYEMPDEAGIADIISRRLLRFAGEDLDWKRIVGVCGSLSYADVVKVAEDSAKKAILEGRGSVTTHDIVDAARARVTFPID